MNKNRHRTETRNKFFAWATLKGSDTMRLKRRCVVFSLHKGFSFIYEIFKRGGRSQEKKKDGLDNATFLSAKKPTD